MPFLTRITRYRPDDDGSFTPFARAFYALLPMVVNELDKGKREREKSEERRVKGRGLLKRGRRCEGIEEMEERTPTRAGNMRERSWKQE